ncbi:hypothetical protein OHC33_002729 [Knufia fluminis]|uniref:Uncharacterized protein n=1 Tax=Knufia fluminis TaxID=191047 RepID=A0AAN8FD65_9EURO|nr:hypothetical protein OHC33_002729 [Knufia fluminis]
MSAQTGITTPSISANLQATDAVAEPWYEKTKRMLALEIKAKAESRKSYPAKLDFSPLDVDAIYHQSKAAWVRGMRLEITLSDFQKFIVMAMMEYLWGDKKMPGQEAADVRASDPNIAGTYQGDADGGNTGTASWGNDAGTGGGDTGGAW